MLPCPFCGSDEFDEGVVDRNEGVAPTPWYYVICRECGVESHGARVMEEAIAHWNRRISTPTPASASGTDGEPWFGCFTGDCPHEKQAECNAAIRREFASLERENAQLRARLASSPEPASGGMFETWFLENYPRNTVIYDPAWHLARIERAFRASEHPSTLAAAREASEDDDAPYCTICGKVATRRDIDGAWWPPCEHAKKVGAHTLRVFGSPEAR